VTLHERNAGAENGREPFKGSKDAASLLVCTRKNIFWLGDADFCEWHHRWKTFRPLWPTSPGPGSKLLDFVEVFI